MIERLVTCQVLWHCGACVAHALVLPLDLAKDSSDALDARSGQVNATNVHGRSCQFPHRTGSSQRSLLTSSDSKTAHVTHAGHG